MSMLKTIWIKKFESEKTTREDELRGLLLIFLSGVVLGIVLGIMFTAK